MYMLTRPVEDFTDWIDAKRMRSGVKKAEIDKLLDQLITAQQQIDRLVVPQQQEIVELRHALAESLKLQSHYASLLNAYDGGKRMEFATPEDWIKRLVTVARAHNHK